MKLAGSCVQTSLQIAGNRCGVCGQNITLSSEGKYCAHCQTVVHTACESRETCGFCGRPYLFEERPQFDPLRDAVLPRALQPAKSGAPVLAVFIMVLMMAAVVIIGLILVNMKSK
jgi:hypothetical protein